MSRSSGFKNQGVISLCMILNSPAAYFLTRLLFYFIVRSFNATENLKPQTDSKNRIQAT